MDSPLVGGVIISGLGAVLFYGGLRSHKKVRKVQDTQKSRIASAPQGYVEIEGFAWPLTSTVTSEAGFEAVYYSIELQRLETRGSGKNKRQEWVTVFTKHHSVPFYVVDATGAVLVEPHNAQLELDSGETKKWYFLSESEKQRLLKNLGNHGVFGFPPPSGFFGFFGGTYRVVENEIYLGCPVYVHGNMRGIAGEPEKITVNGLTTFAQSAFDEKTRNFKNINARLDSNRDGNINATEAQRGYATLARICRQKATNEKITEKEFSAYGVIDSSPEHPLVLADVHENHLVSRMKWKLWLMFFGGAALMAIGLVILIKVLAK